MPHPPDDTLAGRIAKDLADRIIAGTIEPGARLRQDHIAREFGASHVPVREAFRRLEAQGLAVSEPRRGVRAAGFDLAQVKEVAEMRAALESLALRHAARHLTPAKLDEASALNATADACPDVQTWEAANRGFHRMLLAPCAMPRLMAAIDDLHAASARFLFWAWRSSWEAPTDQDHRAILQALRDGDTERAVATLVHHVQWIGRRPVASPSGQIRDAFAIVG